MIGVMVPSADANYHEEWVKITADSWIDGEISQKEFAQVIKFLE